jgi:hypothetical protein
LVARRLTLPRLGYIQHECEKFRLNLESVLVRMIGLTTFKLFRILKRLFIAFPMNEKFVLIIEYVLKVESVNVSTPIDIKLLI